jgi:NAD+ synthase
MAFALSVQIFGSAFSTARTYLMTVDIQLTGETLTIDEAEEVAKISQRLRDILRDQMHRRGYVVAISGGVDSAVCAALSVAAVGPKKVYGLLLPERDSSSNSLIQGKQVAEHLGIEYLTFDIAPALEAIGCYQWRDEAIKNVFPDYDKDWKNKIVITGGAEGQFNHFKLVVQSPLGDRFEKKLGLREYLTIVAATSYKQRIRKTIEYFHADRLHYAVVGTPNRLEYDQGFFVKNGDGSADVKPIAHLYKTQVYALARHLGLPEVVCNAEPTTDTYSMPQGQDEFYFSLPYEQMDIALWAYNHKIPLQELANYFGISETQAQAIYHDIQVKRRTTQYLHEKSVLLEEVDLAVSSLNAK